MAPTKQFFSIAAVCAFATTRYAPQYSVYNSIAWTTALVFFAQLSVYLSYYILIYPQYVSPLRHLPMPPDETMFMGHGSQIMNRPTGTRQRDWNNEVPNDGLIRYLHWFNIERVLVTGPKALSEVLVTKNYDFVKPRQIRAGLGRLLGIGVLLAEGDEHKKQRKDLSPAFSFRHVKDLYPVFWSKSLEMVDCILADIKNRPSTWEKEANVIEVGSYGSRATLDIIGVAGMGQDFGALQDPSNRLNMHYKTVFQPPKGQRYLQMAGILLPQWFLQNLPLKRNREIVEARAYIRDLCRSLIAKKRAKLEKHEQAGYDILSVALESGGFNDEELIDQMMTFLVAGHETTSTALISAIYALANNPKVQTRLREEIHSSLPSPRSQQGQSITSQQIDNLPYLSAVASEVLRLHAPVSITMRVAAKDTTILDQPIPKGTLVIMCPWATNNSYALWGDDALEFNPDRWMQEGQANKGGADSNFALLSFLHGPRSCIGERFARAEFACLLAAWVGRFDFEFEKADFVPEWVGGITTKPKGGLWVRIKERQDW